MSESLTKRGAQEAEHTVLPLFLPARSLGEGGCYNARMKHVSKSQENTKEIARDFVESLKVGAKARVVGLAGDLGAGKTTFSQAVGEVLGVEEHMQSPTFLIEKIYELRDKPWKHLIHIDAYRLEKSDELISLGWEKIISEPENIILVEWADKIQNILPSDTQTIHFNFVDDTTREIEYA
jgi:tRNA threonylcarbamoyladenosine biosynthesis protein TsaE